MCGDVVVVAASPLTTRTAVTWRLCSYPFGPTPPSPSLNKFPLLPHPTSGTLHLTLTQLPLRSPACSPGGLPWQQKALLWNKTLCCHWPGSLGSEAQRHLHKYMNFVADDQTMCSDVTLVLRRNALQVCLFFSSLVPSHERLSARHQRSRNSNRYRKKLLSTDGKYKCCFTFLTNHAAGKKQFVPLVQTADFSCFEKKISFGQSFSYGGDIQDPEQTDPTSKYPNCTRWSKPSKATDLRGRLQWRSDLQQTAQWTWAIVISMWLYRRCKKTVKEEILYQ